MQESINIEKAKKKRNSSNTIKAYRIIGTVSQRQKYEPAPKSFEKLKAYAENTSAIKNLRKLT